MYRHNDQARKDLYDEATQKAEPFRKVNRYSARDLEATQRSTKKGPDPRDPGAMVSSRKPKKPKSPSNAMARVGK